MLCDTGRGSWVSMLGMEISDSFYAQATVIVIQSNIANSTRHIKERI